VTLEDKIILRKAIRLAIKIQNHKALFTCRDCEFYGRTCILDPTKRFVHSYRQEYQMPECFTIKIIDTSFAGMLEIMAGMGIDFHNAKRGWPTLVGRIALRLDRFAFLRVKPRNLERYG